MPISLEMVGDCVGKCPKDPALNVRKHACTQLHTRSYLTVGTACQAALTMPMLLSLHCIKHKLFAHKGIGFCTGRCRKTRQPGASSFLFDLSSRRAQLYQARTNARTHTEIPLACQQHAPLPGN